MAALEYTTLFSNHIRELYGRELVSIDLYNSNNDLQIINGKQLKVPKLILLCLTTDFGVLSIFLKNIIFASGIFHI